MILRKFFLLALFTQIFFSCTKKNAEPERIKAEELVSLLSDVKEIKSDDPVAVSFRPAYYSKGMIANSYKILAYKNLSFLIVEFESAELAKAEAVRLKQYYYKNWLIDEVRGEPSLEELITNKLPKD